MERIYLEYKPVVGGYGHLYLVKHEEFIDSNAINERNSGEVIRAGQKSALSGPLDVYTGVMDNEPQNEDYYDNAGEVAERGFLDITSFISGGVSAWGSLTSLANGMDEIYDYDIAFPIGNSPTANSNAFILTILNAVGIDVRSLLGDSVFTSSGLTFPGADDSATLLARTHMRRSFAVVQYDNHGKITMAMLCRDYGSKTCHAKFHWQEIWGSKLSVSNKYLHRIPEFIQKTKALFEAAACEPSAKKEMAHHG